MVPHVRAWERPARPDVAETHSHGGHVPDMREALPLEGRGVLRT
eukprot:CAMPEP_0119139774 /NCGR_PEP_ID=MMETSP1310-20130426/28098_1 /TAXON_ID=464262 /ORGANISM="Genus nov. species nov., Strain RCC2339" /LENGTH=43 /DNA_ID= /DNA_START= /DNA_END= /DNA_ORIENTATION=